MKKLKMLILATVCSLGVAGVASATPTPVFNYTVLSYGVSLNATGTICRYQPCTYIWSEGAKRLGSGRSLVVKMTTGTHKVRLTVHERTFRNPTNNVASLERDIVVP